jgi:hypothetical protein
MAPISSTKPTVDFNLSPKYTFLLYGLPAVSYIIFIIIALLSVLFKSYNQKSYLIYRTVLLFIFFTSSITGFLFNLGLFLNIKNHNQNETKLTKYNNNIFKINTIVLIVLISISFLYLLLSIPLGCL